MASRLRLHTDVALISFGPQPLPPAAEAELQTVGLLSSIFIDWLSARASNLVTVDTPRTALLLGFIPFDIGIRVAVLRASGTSEPGWKINKTTLSSATQFQDYCADIL